MKLTRITTAKRMGFARAALYTRKDHPKQTMLYMKQKSSFFLAAVTLTAFVAGNMVGEHGWYAFWKSVMGKYDDSLITYTGTVMPISLVPDYSRWSEYGGNPDEHTFKQVPKDVLIPLKSYDPAKQSNPKTASFAYSVGYMGSYETDGDGHGSHPGVDIRVPIGTPVIAIANGIVTSVKNDAGGFGQYIVIRHPHMPDPDHTDYATVLHSSYAHLSSQLVAEGDIVQKGQQIGLSGMTGFATGPHLHFQVDRDTAPWHPYWPFTGAELREAGLSTPKAVNTGFHQERGYEFTVQPMLLVQKNLSAPKNDYAYGNKDVTTVKKTTSVTPRVSKSIQTAASERRNKRLAQISTKTAVAISVPSYDVKPGAELKDKLYLRTSFGEAEFDIPTLSAKNFTDGVAIVKMLPRGEKTVIVSIEPLKVTSKPIKYTGE